MMNASLLCKIQSSILCSLAVFRIKKTRGSTGVTWATRSYARDIIETSFRIFLSKSLKGDEANSIEVCVRRSGVSPGCMCLCPCHQNDNIITSRGVIRNSSIAAIPKMLIDIVHRVASCCICIESGL